MEKNIFKEDTFDVEKHEREAANYLVKGFKYWNALAMNEAMMYLTDETVDREKTSLQEWLIDGRFETILEYVINFIEFNYEKLPLLKAQLKRVKLNSIFDFTNEKDCKTYLESEEKYQQAEPKPAEKLLCPRCGKITNHMEYSLYGKIRICRACQKEEKNLAVKGKKLPFTEWEYIKAIREPKERLA